LLATAGQTANSKKLQLEPAQTKAYLDRFFSYARELVYSDAKLVQNILERPEVAPLAKDSRFAQLSSDARVQSMD
jgi:hypothetical protein